MKGFYDRMVEALSTNRQIEADQKHGRDNRDFFPFGFKIHNYSLILIPLCGFYSPMLASRKLLRLAWAPIDLESVEPATRI